MDAANASTLRASAARCDQRRASTLQVRLRPPRPRARLACAARGKVSATSPTHDVRAPRFSRSGFDHRLVSNRQGDRSRWDGHRVRGRPHRAATPRGDQGHARRPAPPAGHGDAHGPGGVDPRGRPASRHRPRVRVQPPPRSPPVDRDGARRGRDARESSALRVGAVGGRGREAAVRGRGRARGGARAQHRPPRSQARQPAAHADRLELPAPPDRLGRRATRADGQAHARRPHARDADLHVAGAGDRSQHRRAL